MIFLYLTLIDEKTDSNKFMQLYNEYGILMQKTAYLKIHDYQLSEDAVQEAFISIAKNIKKVGDIHSPQTVAYILTITRTCSIKIYNKQHNIVYMEEDDTIVYEDSPSAEENFFQNCDFELAVSALKNLPDTYREILLLKHLYNYSYKEIAELISILIENARKREERAKKMLKQRIEGKNENNC